MNEQMRTLIYYLKETFEDAVIELTEDGFEFVCDMPGIKTNTKIAVNQDNFTLICPDKTIKIDYIGQTIKEKYKQLTDYIIFIKSVMIHSIQSNISSMEVDEENLSELE
jgi:hypothetical protein